MSKFSIIKEVFALFIHKRKFHMFPIIILLIALIGVTALGQIALPQLQQSHYPLLV